MSVSLKNVSRSCVPARGTVQAVRDVTLDIELGEFFSLLGPSGCGKTTTIHCIVGLENTTEGEIFLGDQSWSSPVPETRYFQSTSEVLVWCSNHTPSGLI